MAWTCCMESLHSVFTWLLFREGGNRHPFSAKFRGSSTSYPFVTLSRPGNLSNPVYSKALHKIHPTSSIKVLVACTPSQPTSFTEQNSSPNHLPPYPLQRTPTDNISSQDESPKAPTGLIKCLSCTQPHGHFKSFLHKAKETSPCYPNLLLSRLHSWYLPN